jgi:hypothetical protein
VPGKKMMGYQEGGNVGKPRMTKKQKDSAQKAKLKKKLGKTPTTEGVSLKELGRSPSPAPKVPGKLQSRPMNNTSAPKPPTPADAMSAAKPMGAAPKPMGAAPKPPVTPGAPGGMGAMMKPMGMKKGGKVKKAKSYGHGGKVRGAGIAKKGVKKCKMR